MADQPLRRAPSPPPSRSARPCAPAGRYQWHDQISGRLSLSASPLGALLLALFLPLRTPFGLQASPLKFTLFLGETRLLVYQDGGGGAGCIRGLLIKSGVKDIDYPLRYGGGGSPGSSRKLTMSASFVVNRSRVHRHFACSASTRCSSTIAALRSVINSSVGGRVFSSCHEASATPEWHQVAKTAAAATGMHPRFD